MGSVYKQAGRNVWMIQFYRDGRQIIESSRCTDKADARRLLKAREGDVANGLPLSSTVGKLRFEEAAADLVNDYKMNGHRSLDEVAGRIRNHLVPVFHKRRLSTMTTSHARAYITNRLEEGAANATINRELAALRRMFTLAVQAGKLLHQPHIPTLDEDNTRTGFFSAADLNVLLPHLPAPVRPVIRFAYITGWRVTSEVLPLKWRQIDCNAGEIRLDPGTTKNREGRVFKMTPELRSILDVQREEADRLKADSQIVPWVFFRLVARRGGFRTAKPIRDFRYSWRNACCAAGMPGRLPHDLRRSAVRNMVRAGVPERVSMALTGHKTRSVFERYNIVSDSDLDMAATLLAAASRSANH